LLDVGFGLGARRDGGEVNKFGRSKREGWCWGARGETDLDFDLKLGGMGRQRRSSESWTLSEQTRSRVLGDQGMMMVEGNEG
jgi:hypothetical protein